MYSTIKRTHGHIIKSYNSLQMEDACTVCNSHAVATSLFYFLYGYFGLSLKIVGKSWPFDFSRAY